MSKKTAGWFLLVVVLASCVFLNNSPRDYYDKNFAGKDFSLTHEANSEGFWQTEDSLEIDAEMELSFRGPLLEYELGTLQPGSYTLDVKLSADGEQHTLELYSPYYANPDNTPSKQIASYVLQGERQELTLHAEEPLRDLRVRVHYGGGDFQFESVRIRSVGKIYNDAFFLFLVTIAMGLSLYLWYRKYNQRNPQKDFGCFNGDTVFPFVLFMAFLSTAPAIALYLSHGHDLAFHLSRIESIYLDFLAGQFPHRINYYTANGLGYASPIMYPELFLYIPAALRMLGISLHVSYVTFLFLLSFFTGYVSYLSFHRVFDSTTIGLIAAIAYTLSMNRLVNLHTRAAIGEVTAMAFLPLVFAGMHQILFTERREVHWLVMGMTGILNSHIITLELAGILCALYCVIFIRRVLHKPCLLALLKAVGVTLLVNMWMIVPFLHFSQMDLEAYRSNHPQTTAVYPMQMFSLLVNPFGGDQDLYSTKGEMPLSVGVAMGIALLLFVAIQMFWPKAKRKSEHYDQIGWACFFTAVTMLFVSSVYFPWEVVNRLPVLGSLLSAIQFAWRYFGVATLFLSVVVALTVWRCYPTDKSQKSLVLLCLVLLILNVTPYLDSFSQGGGGTIMLSDKYDQPDQNKSLSEYFVRGDSRPWLLSRQPVLEVENEAERISFDNYERNARGISFDYRLRRDEAVEVLVPLYNYPGYQAVWNGAAPLQIERGENSLMLLTLPEVERSGHVEVRYRGFWYYRLAEGISAVAIIAIAVLWILKKSSLSALTLINRKGRSS